MAHFWDEDIAIAKQQIEQNLQYIKLCEKRNEAMKANSSKLITKEYFTQELHNTIGYSISSQEIDWHWANVNGYFNSVSSKDIDSLNKQKVDYIQYLDDMKYRNCAVCNVSAIDYFRQYESLDMIYEIDDCFFICYKCWQTIGLEKRKWLEYALIELENIKNQERENALTPIEKHERTERKKVNAKFRKHIYKLDSYNCVYCNSHENIIIEHMLPLSRWGTTSEENCVTSCGNCNRQKSNKTPQEANMELKFGRFQISKEK